MKISDAIFLYLKRHGVDMVYMLPGGGAMHLVDSLGQSGIPFVACLHEQGAGYAAIGHAMITGKTAVCLVTSGPGATNAVTPCAAAWTDSVPVLFISGQAPTDTLSTGQRCRGPQEIDIMSIVEEITKSVEEPRNIEDARDMIGYVEELFNLTTEGRPGPCWLSVPLDVQAMEVEYE